MPNRTNPNLIRNPDLAKSVVENENKIGRMITERGKVGAFFGNKTSIPNNVAALTIFLLLIFGILISCFNIHKTKDTMNLSISELWGIITPIITLCIGYLFGGKIRSVEEED